MINNSKSLYLLMERHLACITFVHGELLQLQRMSKELGSLSSERPSYKIDSLQILSSLLTFHFHQYINSKN